MKKFFKILAGTAVVMSMALGTFTLTASAVTNAESLSGSVAPFSVIATGNYTPVRDKTTTSSVRVKITVTTPNNSVASVSVCNGSRELCNYNGPRTVGVNDAYTYIPNTVYENGARKACLRLITSSTSTGASSFTCNGLWSPDLP